MKKLICMLLIINSIFFYGCIEKNVSTHKKNNNSNYLVYNIESLPSSLEMLDNNNIRQQDLLISLFEGLVKTDEKGNIISGLAENWSINKDMTCYKFKIRENAYWSNGNKITSQDFVDFFHDILNCKNNIYNNQLECIFGAKQFIIKGRDFENVAIKSLDDKTLEIKLNYPCSYFLQILAQPIYSLRKFDNNLKDWKDNYKNICYSGPFKINFVSQKQEVTLVKNKEYWNNENIKSLKIKISSIKSREASLANFETSKIDIFIDPPLSEKEHLFNNEEAKSFITNVGEGINFNLNKDGIVKNNDFRKAIAIGIDRQKIIKDILKDTAECANGYVPYNINDGVNGLFRKKNFFSSSSEEKKAKQLIIKSGYNKNKDKVKLVYLNTIKNRKVCEALKENFDKVLGVNIDIEGYDVEEFDYIIENGKYDIAKVNFVGEYNYPMAFLEKWKSNNNIYGYKNNYYNILIEKAKLEKNKFKKKEILQKAEKILMEDLPIVPIYFNKVVVCMKDNIKNIQVTINGNIKLDKSYMEICN